MGESALTRDSATIILNPQSYHAPENTFEYMGEDEELDDPDVVLSDLPVGLRRPFVDFYIDVNFCPEKRGWVQDQLERYAPGYLDAEQAGNGLAIGYGLHRLMIDHGAPLEIL